MNLNTSRKLSRLAGSFSPKLLFQLSYFHNRGRFPNLKSPKNLSEIIGCQMVSGEINQYAPYADKVEMRKYITEWLGEGYLPVLYGVWNHFNEIDFKELPDQFVLKTNHGCNCNIICYDKNKLDLNWVERKIETSLRSVYGGVLETQYSFIKPKVFAEELLSSKNGVLPIDYKFHCLDGKIKGILVCAERGADGEALKQFYNAEWQKVNIMKHHAAPFDFDKPSGFDDMKKVVNEIAKRFKQVRVDLYFVNNRVYVGELTFTPQGGILRNYTTEGLFYLTK